MEAFAIKHKSTLTSGSVVLFALLYVLCGVFGWFDIIQDLFKVDNNAGQQLVMPLSYAVVSILFFVFLIALAVFGYLFKNKVMIFLSFGYNALFIISFVLLGLFATGNITNQTFYNILNYALFAFLVPVYGVIWYLGPLFFLLFIPLIIFGIISIVKAYKKPKMIRSKK